MNEFIIPAAIVAEEAESGILTVERLRENVAQSRRHVDKQEGVIARLTDQGHADALAAAQGLMTTMLEHLTTELAMLDRMEA